MIVGAEVAIPSPRVNAAPELGEKGPAGRAASGRRRIDFQVREAAHRLRADIADGGGELFGPLSFNEEVPGLHVPAIQRVTRDKTHSCRGRQRESTGTDVRRRDVRDTLLERADGLKAVRRGECRG